MAILYTFAIKLYYVSIYIASFFNPKAKRWIQGRRHLFKELSQTLANNQSPIIWFHCASLGEFEQGRPVIEAIKQHKPEYKILVTFFSPSGYDVISPQKIVDFVSYLPLDTPKNAQKFIAMVKPQIALFVKYEFWLNFLRVLNQSEIPLILFSAVFRKNQIFFRWYGSFFRETLRCFNHIFVQNATSMDLLYHIDIHDVTITRDTRLDRVKNIVETKTTFPIIEKFKVGTKLLVIGSSWREDLEILIPFLNEFDQPLKIIIAPHEIKEQEIKYIQNELNASSLRYSEATLDNVAEYDVLIIDNIGMLSSIYQYADFAYVGGAFGDGLHNILEPAVYGIPVFFGKEYQNFQEAIDLIDREVAFSIENQAEFNLIFTRIYYDADKCTEVKQASEKYIRDNAGATEVVVKYLLDLLATLPA